VMYVMLDTRSDLGFTVALLSQFNGNYRQEHWTAKKGLFGYIKGPSEWELTYGLDNTGLVGYCDTDFADDTATMRSFTGYVYMHNGDTVSWQVKKQIAVTLSTAEAEYLAQTEAVKEGLWWTEFIGELNLDCVDSKTIDPYGVVNEYGITIKLHIEWECWKSMIEFDCRCWIMLIVGTWRDSGS